MIKVYRYNDNRNSVSHILQGKNGVTVRYNFERGNVITKQKPELVLKNEYAQNLLENSELFKSKVVTLIRYERTAEDDEKEKLALQTAQEPTPTPEPTPVNTDNVISVPEVRSDDELIAYVNEHYDKSFRTVSNALAFATDKQHLHFPNYKPAQ